MTDDSEYEEYLDLLQEIIDLQHAGNLPDALNLISDGLGNYGEKSELLLLTAVCSYRQNGPGQAIELCEKAHQIDPDSQEVVDSLAVLNTVTGNIHDGLYYAKLATALAPHPYIPDLLPPEFQSFFEALANASPSRHYLDGLYLFNGRRFDDAAREFKSELSLKPDNLDALKKLGHSRLHLGEIESALATLQQYADARPEDAEALALMALGKSKLADFDAAFELCREAAEKSAGSVDVLMQVLEVAKYFDGDLAPQYENFVAMLNTLVADLAADIEAPPAGSHKEPGDPVHVALVSNALYAGDQHIFVLPIIENINQKTVELTVYQQSPTGGPVFQEFKAKSPNWRRIVDMDDDVLALVISRQQTDILVDLCGFSRNSRPNVFRAQPAPVVTNLFCEPFGFSAPGTNVIVADEATYAQDQRNAKDGQTVIKTDGGLFTFDSPQLMGEVKPLPAAENGFITFGAHCNPQQFSPSTIRFWSETLKAVDGSKLLLGNVANVSPETRTRVLSLFADAGIKDRISFLETIVKEGPDPTFFNRIDIFLDATPVNCTVPLCHALWMGVPVVTARSSRRSSLIGASILTSAGKTEWIGDDIEGAVVVASELSTDTAALAENRASLRDTVKGSKLMDTVGYTEKLLTSLLSTIQQQN